MRPRIATSALKHGIPEEDIMHALRNLERVHELDEGFTMVVGASRTGAPLEIGSIIAHDGRKVVIHAMHARPRYQGLR